MRARYSDLFGSYEYEIPDRPMFSYYSPQAVEVPINRYWGIWYSRLNTFLADSAGHPLYYPSPAIAHWKMQELLTRCDSPSSDEMEVREFTI